jgi:hypothetical protein
MNRVLASVIFVGMVLGATTAQATGITSGSQIKILGTDGTLGGGPFAVDGPDAGNLVDFLTFCLEINEFVSYNTLYYVNITTRAVGGGAGGGGATGDPLDTKTAYLYDKFLDGMLDTSTLAKRNGLQLAIWLIEEEVKVVSGAYRRTDNNALVSSDANTIAAANAFLADAANANGSLYGIGVMQLWTNYNPVTKEFSGNKQDQLIRVPDATSTFAALLIGIAFLGLVRTRFA